MGRAQRRIGGPPCPLFSLLRATFRRMGKAGRAAEPMPFLLRMARRERAEPEDPQGRPDELAPASAVDRHE
jgi:hypothetical protein